LATLSDYKNDTLCDGVHHWTLLTGFHRPKHIHTYNSYNKHLGNMQKHAIDYRWTGSQADKVQCIMWHLLETNT